MWWRTRSATTRELPETPPAGAAAPSASAGGGESSSRRWGRRVGTIGFLFFLIKGLLWLLVPALIVAWQWVKSL